MNTLPILIGALCVYALAYRFYSAFIAAKALALDDRRTTPAHQFAGVVALVAVLFILLVTLAGLGIVVVNALSNSSWGVFTIGMTIPIALIMGWWMFKSHAGQIKVAGPSIFGVVFLLGSVIAGN